MANGEHVVVTSKVVFIMAFNIFDEDSASNRAEHRPTTSRLANSQHLAGKFGPLGNILRHESRTLLAEVLGVPLRNDVPRAMVFRFWRT